MPEEEVNLGIMNVGFGDAIYHSAMESEAAYIGRGADTQLISGKESLHAYFF